MTTRVYNIWSQVLRRDGMAKFVHLISRNKASEPFKRRSWHEGRSHLEMVSLRPKGTFFLSLSLSCSWREPSLDHICTYHKMTRQLPQDVILPPLLIAHTLSTVQVVVDVVEVVRTYVHCTLLGRYGLHFRDSLSKGSGNCIRVLWQKWNLIILKWPTSWAQARQTLTKVEREREVKWLKKPHHSTGHN